MHPPKKYLFVLLCLFVVLAFATSSAGSEDLDCQISTRSPRDIADNLLQKMRNGRFDQVEQCLDNLLTSRILTLDGERLLEAVYLNLKDGEIPLKILNKWCASKDVKYSAFVVRGMCRLRSAWIARGSAWGRSIPAERKELMRKKALRAKKDLEKAYRLNPSDPNSAAAMVEVCRALGLDEKTMETWFQRAIQADPVCYFSYSSKLTYLTPRWYGTREKMEKVVNDCRINAPKGTGVYYLVWMDYLWETIPYYTGWKKFMKDPENSQQVADVFDRWLREFPKSTSARVIKARIYIQLEDEKEAIKYCTEALEILPNHIGALRCRANAYFNSGDYKNAERDCRKLLEIAPDPHYAFYTLGNIFMHGYGNYEEAIKLYTRAISLAPTIYRYYVQRGKAKFMLKAYAAAIRNFDKAIELEPTSIQAHYYRGKAKCSLGGYEWAKADFKAAIDTDPEFADGYYALAECHNTLDEKQEARENYIKAKKYDPEKYAKSVDRRLKASEEGLRGSMAGLPGPDHTRKEVPKKTVGKQVEPDWGVRAQIQKLHRQAAEYQGRRDLESAEKLFRKILVLDPYDDQAWFELGEMAYNPTKDYAKAIEYYDKAISINDTDKRYFYKRGMSKYLLHAYESAKDDFISAIRIDPEYDTAFFWLSELFKTLGDTDLARQTYLELKERLGPSESINKALRRLERSERKLSAGVTTQRPAAKAVPEKTGNKEGKPDWQLRAEIQALHDQAARHRGKLDVESAEKDLLKILELDPNDDNAWFTLGEMAYYPAKDYAKAIEYYDKALAINAINRLYLYKRAMSKYYLHDYESAKDDFISAIRIDPEYVHAYFWLGSCFENLGETDLARQNYLKAKESPAYRESVDLALTRLERSKQHSRQPAQIKALYEQVDTHLDGGDTESAQRDLRKILALNPNDDRAWAKLAQIALYPTKDYEKAVEYFEKAIAINAANEQYVCQRGLSKYYLKDFESAKDDFNSAIQIDPKSFNAYYYLGRCYQALDEKDLARENYLKAKGAAPGLRESDINGHLKELEEE